MSFTDSEFIALNLPPGVNFSYNGVTRTLTNAIADALEESGNSRELALAELFTFLESDNVQSETIGKYSYQKWKMRGSDWWRMQAAAGSMDSSQPNVAIRPNLLRRWGWGCLP